MTESPSVQWVSEIDGWLVSSHLHALEVMRDAARFTVDDPRFSTSRVVGPSMLSLDGAAHQRHRAPFVPPFKRSAVQKHFGDWMRVECERRVAGLASNGEAELRTGFAGPLAVAVITRALGLIDVDEEELLSWYRSIVAAVVSVSETDTVPESGPAAMAGLREAVVASFEVPGSLLAGVRASGLTNDEAVSNTAVLMFGAIETSEGATANALLHILRAPASRRRPVEQAVDESLRLEPAAAVIDRYATRGTTLAGIEIAAGDLVRVSLRSANRDPAVFVDPDGFIPSREGLHRHLAFVQGPHACLGLHLARLETVEAVRAILDGLPGITLDNERTDEPSGSIFRKPDRVTAKWDTP